MSAKFSASPVSTLPDKRKPMVILPVARASKANLFIKKEPGKVVVLKPGKSHTNHNKMS